MSAVCLQCVAPLVQAGHEPRAILMERTEIVENVENCQKLPPLPSIRNAVWPKILTGGGRKKRYTFHLSQLLMIPFQSILLCSKLQMFAQSSSWTISDWLTNFQSLEWVFFRVQKYHCWCWKRLFWGLSNQHPHSKGCERESQMWRRPFQRFLIYQKVVDTNLGPT